MDKDFLVISTDYSPSKVKVGVEPREGRDTMYFSFDPRDSKIEARADIFKNLEGYFKAVDNFLDTFYKEKYNG